MCECIENNWVREWQETLNGKYPASVHHPLCNEYTEFRYVRISLDGQGTPLIIDPKELSTMEFGDDEYRITDVYLTKDQFDKLPVFQGF